MAQVFLSYARSTETQAKAAERALVAAGFTVWRDGPFFLLLFGAVFLNDEYQRLAIDSIRRGRRGGSVAFLGIDGSGKSSHASTTARWLSDRGYHALLMPFHRYLFVERLSGIVRSSTKRVASRSETQGGDSRKRGRNPTRPLLSLVDNLKEWQG